MVNVENLWAAFNTASKRLMQIKGTQGNQLEHEYARAYQALVRAGVCQQIRKKYRG